MTFAKALKVVGVPAKGVGLAAVPGPVVGTSVAASSFMQYSGGETTMAIGWTNTTSPESVVEILCTTQYGVVDGVGCAALDLDGITKHRVS